ncbi:MAG: carboxylesterase family protein [Alteromonadaceae bacterium]|nr:carboxylesterase family protein [Alteromonadaceae bacterium]
MKRILSHNKLAFAAVVLLAAQLSGCAQPQSDATPGKSDQTLVSVAGGQLKGYQQQDIVVFKGIPYAAPPVGENRWRAPQPSSWQGVKDATSFGNDCMQKPFPSDAAPLGETPAEDCLYLNIWAPEDASNTPVVIWIHGGGYVNGGASPKVYDGSEFAKNDVMFVSFNYRLGRFGFFAHPALRNDNGKGIANFAFMDQIAALKWVRENIAAFGGNPDKITVMGESAGGGSVHTLMQADESKHLFDAAIVMSGGGRSLMGERHLSKSTDGQPSAEQIGLNFAASNNISGTSEAALDALRQLPAEVVLDGLSMMSFMVPRNGPPTYVGGPITEGDIVQGTTEEMLLAGKVANMPVMVGTTGQDIGFMQKKSKQEVFAMFGEEADKAQSVYDPDGNTDFQLVNYSVGQDFGMQEPARFFATKMTAAGEPVYLYRFNYVADEVNDGRGAHHASEIPFFFKTIDDKYEHLTETDWQASEYPFQYVVNFVKSGSPNGADLPQWQPFDPDEDKIMIFTANGNAEYVTDPWRSRLDLVESAY